MKPQLLCTFTTYDLYKSVLDDIKNYYNIELIYGKLFILQNSNNSNDVFITYNVQSDKSYIDKTISFHRIKDFNCLYTINSLNALVKQENNGLLDKTFKIDWSKFVNTIIVNKDDSIKIISTKLLSVYLC